MKMPKRIQRRRSKGWKMPEGAVCVTRPGKWGNPFIVSDRQSAELAVARFREQLSDRTVQHLIYPDNAMVKRELRGKDLACWCALCEKHKEGRPWNEPCADCPPCHADIELEIANS